MFVRFTISADYQFSIEVHFVSARLHQKTGANLRKLQLVDIASDLISREGLDAVKHATLAELAGCTRALVYRYFPRKSDIYIAITESYYEEFDRLLSVEEQQYAIASGEDDPSASRRVFTLLFEVMDKHGIAASILANTPALSKELQAYDSEIKRRYQQRWLSAFEQLGLVGVQAELLITHCTSIMINTYYCFLNGDISRDNAIDEVQHTVAALISSALADIRQRT